MSDGIGKKTEFNIQIVGEKFEVAVREDDDVHIQLYLESFEELNKFFLLMGSVFGFICKDIREKIDVLYELQKSPDESEYFSSVKRMIEYEKEKGLLNKKGYISGSRTLLRLHRGLDFIQVFLKKLGDIKDVESTSGVCREAYDLTLAKFHPFIIRNGARVAIYTLPTKEILLKRVCGNDENIRKAITYLPQALQATSVIYNRIEHLYAVYDLHELP